MNKTINLALLGAAVFGVATATQAAPVVVRITGSTAFRGLVYPAVVSLFSPITAGYTNLNSGSLTLPAGGKANQVTLKGKVPTLFGANDVTVELSWNGSVEGINAVIEGGALTGTTATPLPFLTETGAVDGTQQADYAFSDVAQVTTTLSGPGYQNAIDEEADPTNYGGQGIGVVTFGYVANNVAKANVNNIASQQLTTFLGNGTSPLGFFYSNSGDSRVTYLVGRYGYSGTRLITAADAGLPANVSENLFLINSSTIVDVDSTGQISGSGVAGILNTLNPKDPVTSANAPMIGYLGAKDANGVSNGAILTYNGVALSKANVKAGTYSCWSYEHLYRHYRNVSADVITYTQGTTAPGSPITSNGLIRKLNDQLVADGDYAALSEMKASRQADGGAVVAGF